MREAVRRQSEKWTDDELFACVQGRTDAEPSPPEALELLFDRYHARVLGQCARLLGDAAAAEDATQEIFLSMLEKRMTYRAEQHFGSWLYVVTRNHCLNRRRRHSKEVRSEDPGEVFAELLVDPLNPERDLQGQESAQLVSRLCDEVLTPREREVIHLRYFWGQRVKQINEALGLTNTSGARSHLATAHRKLRRALSAHLGPDVLDHLFGEE